MFHNIKFKYVAVTAVIFSAILAFAVLQPFAGRASQPVTLLNETQDNITIGATFDPTQQRVDASISYDYLNPQGVQAYIDFCREKSNEIAQQNNNTVYTRVIFSRPLSQKEFESFVERYSLQVHRYVMRAVEPNGTRITIEGAPESNTLIPENSLQSVQTDIQSRNGAEFKGWIQADVTSDGAGFAKMQQDADIFVTEATYTLIHQSMTTEALERAGATQPVIQNIQALSGQAVQMIGPVLYWGLEDMQLVPLPVHSQSSTTE